MIVPKFSIIIPVCGNEDLTNQCLYSIAKNLLGFEVIVIDNGSALPFQFSPDLLRFRTSAKYNIIRNEKNLGFPIAVNQGIKAATGEIIVVLNNDTLVFQNFFSALEKHLKIYDMVGPVSNSVSGPQKIVSPNFGSQNPIADFAYNIYQEKLGAIYPWHRLVFFCVAIKREVIDKIGLLDEQFSPGNFEDDDFCLRAIEAGFKLGVAEDIFIYHAGSATHKSLNIAHQQLMATNQAKFQAKWPEWKYQFLKRKCLKNFEPENQGKKLPLALCMIVKNEEKGLERAILSVIDLVDEIVIAVDNSSIDKTAEIAKKYATTLKFFDWQDDYSTARNFCHAGVKSEWILFLDGHEYLKECPDLANKLKLVCDGLLCTVEMENGMRFRNPRLYKNGMEFENQLHELQKMSKVLPYPEFIVKHDRTGGQDPKSSFLRNRQRDEEVPRIMGDLLKKDSSNVRALFHLGLYFGGIGDHKKAIKYFNRYLKFSQNKSERWYVLFNRSLCHLALNHCFRAYWSASCADDETPGRWEIEKLKGLILFQRQKFSKAIEALVGSFKINTGDQTYRPWTRDETGTWNLIGEAFFNLGNYYKASIAFDKAASTATDPDFKNLLAKRAALLLDILRKK